ncbi:MAG: hypothetical protein ACOYL1_04250 [Chlamydiia bacterium]
MIFKIALNLFLAVSTNPFLLDVEPSNDESVERLEELQTMIATKDVWSEIQRIYPEPSFWGHKYKPLEDFYRRSMRGFQQTLINRSKGYLPEKKLIEINGGGRDCIVLSCPFNRNYPELLYSLIEALKEIGFRGAVYYRIGGFPNPTGEEVRYLGVPYSFKIFTMLEAYNLGYKNILWLDSAVYPVRNPASLFRMIENNGAVISWKKFRRVALLPETEAILHETTGYRPTQSKHVCMQVFGLRMDLPWVKNFIEDYYAMVRQGTPFFSCYPEEHVITALMFKYREHLPTYRPKLILSWSNENVHLVKAYDEGYMFYLRKH